MKILNMTDKQYENTKRLDKDFRMYHWYERHNHINERIIRCLESILFEYRAKNIEVNQDGTLELNINNYIIINNFDYNSYEIGDIKRTLPILEDYIRRL